MQLFLIVPLAGKGAELGMGPAEILDLESNFACLVKGTEVPLWISGTSPPEEVGFPTVSDMRA